MQKLSSIIIAKDEEKNIGRCIESQLGCIDDILIFVDDTTTDKTVEIIKRYENVRYEIVKWQGYAKTKQLALDKSLNNWVLWIDADEALTDELKKELTEFKAHEPEYQIYRMKRRAYFLGRWIKHSGWYPGKVERLFNKESVKFNDSSVHEGLEFNCEAGEFKSDLLHYTYYNVAQYLNKYNIYTSLHAEEMYKRNKKAGIIDFIIRPPALFIKMYFIKLGFLDGIHGFILAVLSANYVFTKYLKLWEIKNNKERN